jgi:hypothetical protein
VKGRHYFWNESEIKFFSGRLKKSASETRCAMRKTILVPLPTAIFLFPGFSREIDEAFRCDETRNSISEDMAMNTIASPETTLVFPTCRSVEISIQNPLSVLWWEPEARI